MMTFRQVRVVLLLCLVIYLSAGTIQGDTSQQNLVFSEEFNELNFDVWQHEITMSGGGVSEFLKNKR